MPKVGEKTASELLKQFQTLDNLYAHVEEVTKKAVRESLIANKDLAYLSLDLATIRIDSPVVLDWNEARLGERIQRMRISCSGSWNLKICLDDSSRKRRSRIA